MAVILVETPSKSSSPRSSSRIGMIIEARKDREPLNNPNEITISLNDAISMTLKRPEAKNTRPTKIRITGIEYFIKFL